MLTCNTSSHIWLLCRKIIQKPELTKIKNVKIYQIPHEDCFFEPVSDRTNNISEPLSILKCKSHIENNRDMVTFRGVIKVKKFTDSLPSRTLEIPAVYGFGTPGIITVRMLQKWV